MDAGRASSRMAPPICATPDRVVALNSTGVPKVSNEGDLPFLGCQSNEVHTSKYTLTNFVCKITYEQLQRGVNLYFLFACLLTFIGHNTSFCVGTIKASSTLAVLVVMMSISAAVSIIDELNRQKADMVINAQATRKLDLTTGWQETTWTEVKVGDLLMIEEGEEVPADGVALCCSREEGYLYVSTSSLDGETSLKLQDCVPLSSLLEGKDISGDLLRPVVKEYLTEGGLISVTAEPPSSSIHTFNGNLRYGRSGVKVESLDKSNFVLRGSKLKNTKWAVVLVTYVGTDTRIMKNIGQIPSEPSHLESANSKAMLVTAIALAIISLVSDVMHYLNEQELLGYWYLFPKGEPKLFIFPPFIAWWFSFFTLYSNMVTVSLYSTMEMVNFFQARSIKENRMMASRPVDGDHTATVRSTNLCQELGQVSHIFSDKTGTLTKNQMTARAFCTIDEHGNSTAYRISMDELGGKRTFEGPLDNEKLKMALATAPSCGANPATELMKALSVAHTVMVAQEHGTRKYMAESPDERALVEAAKGFKWEFQDRKGDQVYIKDIPAFTLLATNAFTSSRGCMPVLVRHQKELILFVKGSDTVMLGKANSARQKTDSIERDLNRFAKEGLRTLLVGIRKIPEDEGQEFIGAYNDAKSLQDRDAALAKVAQGIEKDLTLVGITAIEDELQDKVGDIIQMIRQAGISLWVLTGDKLETAKAIGFSTQVLRDKRMEITEISGSASKEDFHNKFKRIIKLRNDQLKEYEQMSKAGARLDVIESALMITGQALTQVIEDGETKELFLDAANACPVVIACQVAPYQKADLVDMVRNEKKREDKVTPNRVTPAVGDGANDVPMIQCAKVGVGIYGREGHQAVNSDFAIGEFQFLQKLLLMHGRWNYRRTCKFLCYIFWRCTVQVLLCFYFTFYHGFAATRAFHENIRLSFNVVLAPVICAVGCFDRDITETFILAKLALCAPGPRDNDLNLMRMLQQLLSAIAHSVFMWVVMLFAFSNLDLEQSGDLYTFGTAVWTVLIADCQLHGFFLTITWTSWNTLAVVASTVGYAVAISWEKSGLPVDADLQACTDQDCMLGDAFADDSVSGDFYRDDDVTRGISFGLVANGFHDHELCLCRNMISASADEKQATAEQAIIHSPVMAGVESAESEAFQTRLYSVVSRPDTSIVSRPLNGCAGFQDTNTRGPVKTVAIFADYDGCFDIISPSNPPGAEMDKMFAYAEAIRRQIYPRNCAKVAMQNECDSSSFQIFVDKSVLAVNYSTRISTIMDMLGLRPDQCYLSFFGKPLEAEMTIRTCGIQRGNTVHIRSLLLGGAPPSGSPSVDGLYMTEPDDAYMTESTESTTASSELERATSGYYCPKCGEARPKREGVPVGAGCFIPDHISEAEENLFTLAQYPQPSPERCQELFAAAGPGPDGLLLGEKFIQAVQIATMANYHHRIISRFGNDGVVSYQAFEQEIDDLCFDNWVDILESRGDESQFVFFSDDFMNDYETVEKVREQEGLSAH